jgi:hypothetical protein
MNQPEQYPAGTVIDGRYRIESRLGRGGFATVYRSEHLQLGRPAALKVLEPVAPHHTERFRARFNTEARIAANLDHPHVVRIFDFGFIPPDDRPYIAMELLEGSDLEEVLSASTSMPPQRAKKLFEGVIDALRVGHERGIVHKDLKPANLFLVKQGTPQEKLVVLDYGIARLEGDDNPRMTEEGTYTGTPAYMPPEYIHRKEVTPAYDVYQIGLIFIEAMTGQPVIVAGSNLAYMVAHANGQHRIPDGFGDTELGATLLRAIAVDPADRYATCGELLDAVRVASVSADADFTLPRITLDEAEAVQFAESGRTTEREQTVPDGHEPSKGMSAGIVIALIALALLGCFGLTAGAGVLVWLSAGQGSDDPVVTGPLVKDAPEPPALPTMPHIGAMSEAGQEMSAWILGRYMVMAVLYQVRLHHELLAKTGGWSKKGASFVPSGTSDLLSIANQQLETGLTSDPHHGALEKAAKAVQGDLNELGDTLDDLYDYHSVMRGWESDGGAHGKVMTKRLLDLEEKFSTKWRKFSKLVDSELQKHLAQQEDAHAKKPFLAVATTAMRAEHKLVMTMASKPKSKAAAKALSDFDAALKPLEKYVRAHRPALTERYKITAGIHERYVSSLKETRKQAAEIRAAAKDGGDVNSKKLGFWSQLHSTFNMYTQLGRY